MTVVVFEEDVLRLTCGYASQSGRSSEEKHDELKGEWDMHSADDLVICLADINGHVARNINGFYAVSGVYGIGKKNL